MAILHFSTKSIGRRQGRSAVAAAAYRSATKLLDKRTGLVYDFRRRRGVLHTAIVLPHDSATWASDRGVLWSSAETAEVRSDARTAREIEVALPIELSEEQRTELALNFARELAERHQVCVDVAVHAPGRGDQRNFHAHLLMTTRRLGVEKLEEKTREWEDRKGATPLILWWRERWADLVNAALRAVGSPERVDHRSLAEQGIDRTPQVHLGPHASAVERRTGQPSRRRLWGQLEAPKSRSRGKTRRTFDEAVAINSHVHDLRIQPSGKSTIRANKLNPKGNDL